MAISNAHVKELERITVDLGDLIRQMNPGTIKEWDAFDGAVAAHKNLRKLDTDSLRQLELPLTPKTKERLTFRKDCPRCAGSGHWADPADKSGTPRPCLCREVEDVAWPKIKKEWKAQLQPAEV